MIALQNILLSYFPNGARFSQELYFVIVQFVSEMIIYFLRCGNSHVSKDGMCLFMHL